MSTVQFSTFNGIDVNLDSENSVTFSLLDDGINPVLNVKTFGKRPDITPQIARELAEALMRFADHHDPVPDSVRLRLYGTSYPSLGVVAAALKKEEAAEQVAHANRRGYFDASRVEKHDAEVVEAVVRVNWETPAAQ